MNIEQWTDRERALTEALRRMGEHVGVETARAEEARAMWQMFETRYNDADYELTKLGGEREGFQAEIDTLVEQLAKGEKRIRRLERKIGRLEKKLAGD